MVNTNKNKNLKRGKITMYKKLYISLLAVVAFVVGTVPAFAAFTLPELPTTNIEAAGVAVAALVAVYAVIKMAIRMIKGL